MRLYFVDPPPYEYAGEGEDNREWFGNLAEATKRYNHWVRECRATEAARNSNDPDKVAEVADFRFCRVVLAAVDVPMDKAGLLRYLNNKFPAGEMIKEYG